MRLLRSHQLLMEGTLGVQATSPASPAARTASARPSQGRAAHAAPRTACRGRRCAGAAAPAVGPQRVGARPNAGNSLAPNVASAVDVQLAPVALGERRDGGLAGHLLGWLT
jgi:hypothetical protein